MGLVTIKRMVSIIWIVTGIGTVIFLCIEPIMGMITSSGL